MTTKKMLVKKVAPRTRPEMFIVVGVEVRNRAYNILDRADSEAAAIKIAGQYAVQYTERNGYKGIAVYELKGMAKKPEVPVDFVSVASL